jgi:hypothetical protein
MICRHCRAELSGPYCHACGQKAVEEDALTARAFFADGWAHVSGVDFKTLDTLRALLIPGKLTAEFVEGHRRPYLTPIKIYLLCGGLFFLASPYTGFTLENIVAIDRTGLIAASVADARLASGLSPQHFADRFDLRFQTVYTITLSLSVAALAVFAALLFRAKQRPAGVHVVFALHYVSFLYLLGIVIGFATRTLPEGLSLPVLYTMLAPYMFFALRRVYQEPALRTTVKTILLLGATLVVDALVNLLAFMLTLRAI